LFAGDEGAKAGRGRYDCRKSSFGVLDFVFKRQTHRFLYPENSLTDHALIVTAHVGLPRIHAEHTFVVPDFVGRDLLVEVG